MTSLTDRDAHATLEREISEQIRELLDPPLAGPTSGLLPPAPQLAQVLRLASRCVEGGKLLRPRLLLGAFDSLQQQSDSPARGTVQTASRPVGVLRIAAAIELLHFSFLLHDDVIDEDLFRRGERNLIGRVLDQTPDGAPERNDGVRERPLHWARTNGILVGNLMLTAAHQVYARQALRFPDAERLLDLFDIAVSESVVGELCDVGLSDGVIASDLSTVLEMTRMKTATYTFELPLRTAAVLAGASIEVEEALGQVGRHLGVAFQLQDDLLSAFGSASDHGKDPFSDFREGKETALIAYARMTAHWPSLEPLVGAPGFTEDDGRAIRRMLVDCGAESFIRSMVEDQIRTALDGLSREDGVVPTATAQWIAHLVDTLEGRTA
ncbi:polyprenyl synthetase family protein [Leucobacter tardus]|uniref:Polyprenyl synthetase family protein n=1 Tax=Leucobacter tardus TaxID=501483 RepID=A0A939TS05_9MICO|nr:polyprenyl synthetase family protein [Leucobacter tardus]MBO2990582.1 polyprenyl synthetase family protein [Leucobacter tardus]